MDNGGKYLMGVIALLVTIALSMGGYAMSQLDSKVSVREIDLMRARLVRIENKLDRVINKYVPYGYEGQ